MQDLGIKSLFHLDQVEVTVVHEHLKQCRRIASIGERDSRLSNGSFNLNLLSITRTLTNGLEKNVCLGNRKKTMGWGGMAPKF
jgi:hypothetical protein